MTSDTTQTEQVASETENDTTADLGALLAPVRVVLWDFDGPICRLFAGHSAQRVAVGLVEWLEMQGLRGLLTERERKSPDPHAVLRAVDLRHPGSDLVAELEERLTQEELKATASAMPTAWADPLIRTLAAVDRRLAITTNNSPRVVTTYLKSRGLTSCFVPHIYGRTRDLHLLKPDPDCLNRALRAVGAAAGRRADDRRHSVGLPGRAAGRCPLPGLRAQQGEGGTAQGRGRDERGGLAGAGTGGGQEPGLSPSGTRRPEHARPQHARPEHARPGPSGSVFVDSRQDWFNSVWEHIAE